MLMMAQPDAEKAFRLIDLRQYIDGLELEFSQVAAEFKESDHWKQRGETSAIDWIRINCHMTSNAAADRIAVGERCDDMAQSVQAMHAGDIGFAHLTVMARTANAVDVFDEERLVQLARDSTPGKFHYECLHYRHALNSKKYAKEQADMVHGNTLHMNRGEDGSFFLTGWLDPVGGASVRNALEPLARPSGKDDHRLRPQRMADALIEMASGGKPANIQVTATIETLKDLAGAPGAEMEFSLPMSSAAVQGMACDCSVTRVLLSEESLVMDVGRAKRMVSAPLKRALKARDGHCRWPGCERPASWCDGHHVVHWIDGGSTDLNNLVLLCRRHHRMVHESGWQLIKTEAGEIITIAPSVQFSLRE